MSSEFEWSRKGSKPRHTVLSQQHGPVRAEYRPVTKQELEALYGFRDDQVPHMVFCDCEAVL